MPGTFFDGVPHSFVTMYMLCPDCGQTIRRRPVVGTHICDPARKLEYELAAYLESPEGQFEVYYAATRRPEGET